MAWLLILIVIGLSAQDVTKKIYARKSSCGTYSFAAVSTLVAMVFFVISSGGNLHFSCSYLGYAIGFGISYSAFMIFSLLAIRTGPLSLTALVISCSLILPALYGLVILSEPISLWLILGIILLLAALALINLEKKNEEKRICLKWLIFVTLGFFSNGFCSILQKAQQLSASSELRDEFMVTALFLAGILLLCCALLTERKTLPANLVKGLPWYTLCGGANGMVNLLVLVLSKTTPASVMFPIISAGGILMTFLVSVLFYKERLSAFQLLGILFGAAAAVFLSL